MSVDFAALALELQGATPLLSHLQIKVTELGPGHGVALLPDAQALADQDGDQHAGALFAVGEAAAGAAVAATLAEHLGDPVGRAVSARIDYRGVARGPITATAALSGSPGDVAAAARADGAARCDVDVVLHDAREQQVAAMQVGWAVGETKAMA